MTSKTKLNNPYIELVDTIPQYLYSCQSREPNNYDIEQIKAVIKNKLIYLEVGSGSGQHLIKQAQTNPNNFYLGIELRYKRAFKTAQKTEKLALTNLFVVRGDAKFLPLYIEPLQVQQIFINFPDPWDRRRWHKHRLTSDNFLNNYKNLLTHSGKILFKTDHPNLFYDTINLVNSNQDYQITKITKDLHNCEQFKDNNVETEFEQLFKSKKMNIFCIEIVKN